MLKVAVIDSSNKVGQLIMAKSLEEAKALYLGKFDVSDVVDTHSVEGGDKAAIGCEWDGVKILPLPGTELDELYPTSWGPDTDETVEA